MGKKYDGGTVVRAIAKTLPAVVEDAGLLDGVEAAVGRTNENHIACDCG